ncbi:MAG TPA: hypothetical protein VJ579_02455 [Candidatus Paceibacterota bacterium]|nr:hypothetical protein [Candidatus Paceibacterota bacterium]
MVAISTPPPFFTGTYQEVGDRILAAGVDELLDAMSGETYNWGGLILRLLIEQTPFAEVETGSTRAGLFLRHKLLCENWDLSDAFAEYGESLWSLFAKEMRRILDDKVYPVQLMSRIGCILSAHRSPIHDHYISYIREHMDESRALRIAAALNSTCDWYKVTMLLKGTWRGDEADSNAILIAAFDLMSELDATIESTELLRLVANTRLLPELRAAAFKLLSERKEAAHDLIPFALLATIESPGNAAALHSACWRAPRLLPESVLLFVGNKLLAIDTDRFERQDAGSRRWVERNIRMHTAIANYYLNLPEHLRIAIMSSEQHQPLAIKFASMMTLMHLKERVCETPLAIAAESTFGEVIWDESALSSIMLLYDYTHVPGRPKWSELSNVLPQYREQITATTRSIVRNLRITGKHGDWPTANIIVRFLKVAWKNATIIKRNDKILLRDILESLNDTRFLDAYRDLRKFLKIKKVIK